MPHSHDPIVQGDTLDDLAREAALHSMVAAMGWDTRNATPALRLAREERVDAAPERFDIVSTGLDPEGRPGHVHGDLLVMEMVSRTAAPAGALVLPEGNMLAFTGGEMFILHALGAVCGSEPDFPRTRDPLDLFVEAGRGGVILHGPAVLSLPVATGILARVQELEKIIDSCHEEEYGRKYDSIFVFLWQEFRQRKRFRALNIIADECREKRDALVATVSDRKAPFTNVRQVVSAWACPTGMALSAPENPIRVLEPLVALPAMKTNQP